MAARVGLNLTTAAYCVRLARRERAAGAKVGALAMVIATLDDGRRIAALHPASFDFSFVPEAGQTYSDSGSAIACH